jgi:hypothetical protein
MQPLSTIPLSFRRSALNYFGSPRPLQWYVRIERVGALDVQGLLFDSTF